MMPNQQRIQHHLVFSDLKAAQLSHPIEIAGQEAHHAVRVKRIKVDDQVIVLDAQGTTAKATVAKIAGSRSKPTLILSLSSIDHHDPITPQIEIYAALPKGDRLDRMIDQLSQLGVARYRPLLCARSQRKNETVRWDKIERIALEATKQCQRPWSMTIGEPVTLHDALNDPDAIVADASGAMDCPQLTSPRSVILIGPEGGWSDEERALITATKAPIVRFGVFVLRIEAAACSASAIVLSKASADQGHLS